MFSRALRPPQLSDAADGDAAAIARLHAASFHRGWSEEEIEAMLLDRSVLAHRAMIGRHFAGFIISRQAADEAEILSIAVAQDFRWTQRRPRPARPQSRSARERRRAHRVSRGRREQRAGAAALPAGRLRRGRPARGLLPRRVGQARHRPGAAARPHLRREFRAPPDNGRGAPPPLK